MSRLVILAFMAFTADNNLVERAEFIRAWHDRGLGSEESANALFQKADTDGDGVINMDPDVKRVFKYFDMNGEPC